MTSPDARLLFDECIPRPLVSALRERVDLGRGREVVVQHFLEIWPAGVFDEVWVPRLIGENWTVISGDDGRQPNKNRGRKLPRLCVENGITLVVLSPTVHGRRTPEKLLTIISTWEGILEIAADPKCRGNRYMIEPSIENASGVGRITEKYIRPQAPAPPPTAPDGSA